jgi:prepilin-type N-terminal cleavage/methylation domain-containing protein
LRYNEITMKRWLNQRLERSRGFTIVELLIVIAIIGILAVIVVAGYGAVVNNAHDGSVRSDLQKIDDAFKVYALDSEGIFPNSYSELGGLGIKIAAGSYETRTQANVYLCTNPSATEYAVIAMSKSQKRFVVKSESGISEYDGDVVWNEDDALQDETCESIDPTYQSPNNITGMIDANWLSWTGAEGAIASILCSGGYIVVPGNATFGTDDFCVMKYEAKDVDGVATSEPEGTPWVSISQTNAISEAASACETCHLITEGEWLTIAHDVLNVASNWSGGSVGSGYIYSGHNDSSPANSLEADSDDGNGYSSTEQTSGSQRRTLTLSNGEVIWDFAGNVYEWLDELTSDNQPGPSGEISYNWKEWNSGGLLAGGLSSSIPSYGTPMASGWSSAQGLGTLYSNYSDTTSKPFARGGAQNSSGNAGVLGLYLGYTLASSSVNVGFRAAK